MCHTFIERGVTIERLKTKKLLNIGIKMFTSGIAAIDATTTIGM